MHRDPITNISDSTHVTPLPADDTCMGVVKTILFVVLFGTLGARSGYPRDGRRRKEADATQCDQRGRCIPKRRGRGSGDRPEPGFAGVRAFACGVYIDGAASQIASTDGVAGNIQQTHREFEPDFLVVPAGSTASFPNFDPIFHNVFSLSKPKSFDLGNYPKGQTRTLTFMRPGIVFVNCHLHPNMAASIVVSPTRWRTRAGADGHFELTGLPPGKYTLIAWHKSAGFFLQTVLVKEDRAPEVRLVMPFADPLPSLALR